MSKRKTEVTDDDDPFAFLDEEKPKAKVKKAKVEDDPFSFLEEEDKPSAEEAPPKPASRLRRGMPEEVPILVADDMSYCGDGGPGGRRSLEWWLYWTFSSCQPYYKGKYPDDVVEPVLREVLSERLGSRVKHLWKFWETSARDKKPPLAWQAACWNETLRRLGYEIPQRRCKDPGIK